MSLCHRCHKRETRIDRKRCDVCNDKKKRYMRLRAYKLHKNNKCIICGGVRDGHTKVCSKCYNRYRRNRKNLVETRLSKGLCTVCGLPIVDRKIGRFGVRRTHLNCKKGLSDHYYVYSN